uniref:NADH-ubiquinone oxidoreductase chain 6 n=1 Tax=Stichopus japonicus TaxID=307972 RepID=D2DLA8_STIJA|nr:NADH dehydrogenase subunit 6 [Apostichopus japonicus]
MVFYLFMLLLLLGSTLVFYSLSPYYAALGLMISSLFGCVVLTSLGLTFLALLLLLIYMGGMLVVFVYSSALSADRYPMVSNLGEVGVAFFVAVFLGFFLYWSASSSQEPWFNFLSPFNSFIFSFCIIRYGGSLLACSSVGSFSVLDCGFGSFLWFFSFSTSS